MIEGDFIILSTKQKKDLMIVIVNYIILCLAIVILIFSYKFTEKNIVSRYSKDISEEWHDYKGSEASLVFLSYPKNMQHFLYLPHLKPVYQ